jgi:hypothetical protein
MPATPGIPATLPPTPPVSGTSMELVSASSMGVAHATATMMPNTTLLCARLEPMRRLMNGYQSARVTRRRQSVAGAIRAGTKPAVIDAVLAPGAFGSRR